MSRKYTVKNKITVIMPRELYLRPVRSYTLTSSAASRRVPGHSQGTWLQSIALFCEFHHKACIHCGAGK